MVNCSWSGCVLLLNTTSALSLHNHVQITQVNLSDWNLQVSPTKSYTIIKHLSLILRSSSASLRSLPVELASQIYLWIRTSKQNIRRVSGLRQIRAGLAKRPLLRKACQWNAYSFQFLRFSTSPHATAGSSSPQNGAEPIYKDVWRQSHQVGTGTWQKVHPPKPPKTKKQHHMGMQQGGSQFWNIKPHSAKKWRWTTLPRSEIAGIQHRTCGPNKSQKRGERNTHEVDKHKQLPFRVNQPWALRWKKQPGCLLARAKGRIQPKGLA